MAVFTRTDLPGERQVYRTSGSLVAWWAWVAFAVVLLIVLALGHRDHAALVTASVVIAITGIMYACALRPRIVADAAGITVVNPLRVHEVPWPAVTQVDLVHNVRVHYRSPARNTPANGTPARAAGRGQASRGHAGRGEDRAQLGGAVHRALEDPERVAGPPRRPPGDDPGARVRPAPRRGPGGPGRIGGRIHRPATGRTGPGAALRRLRRGTRLPPRNPPLPRLPPPPRCAGAGVPSRPWWFRC